MLGGGGGLPPNLHCRSLSCNVFPGFWISGRNALNRKPISLIRLKAYTSRLILVLRLKLQICGFSSHYRAFKSPGPPTNSTKLNNSTYIRNQSTIQYPALFLTLIKLRQGLCEKLSSCSKLKFSNPFIWCKPLIFQT